MWKFFLALVVFFLFALVARSRPPVAPPIVPERPAIAPPVAVSHAAGNHVQCEDGCGCEGCGDYCSCVPTEQTLLCKDKCLCWICPAGAYWEKHPTNSDQIVLRAEGGKQLGNWSVSGRYYRAWKTGDVWGRKQSVPPLSIHIPETMEGGGMTGRISSGRRLPPSLHQHSPLPSAFTPGSGWSFPQNTMGIGGGFSAPAAGCAGGT